jgi:putative nucleotidyltransferase with HDIG domain
MQASAVALKPVPSLVPKRRVNQAGHGARLTAALKALESFPALIGPRDLLLELLGREPVPGGEVVAAIEADVALSIGVLRMANEVAKPAPPRVESIVEAVRLLPPEALRLVAQGTRTFDFFQRASTWAPERFRSHALSTRHAAEQVARMTKYDRPDRLIVSSLLHDVGKLVLVHAYPDYPDGIHAGARTPEERVHAERRELGVDHALVGGVLARRWGLPKSVATAIERHHSDDVSGEGPYVRLADMLAHQAEDGAVAPAVLLQVAAAVGIGPPQLRLLMCNLPHSQVARREGIDPCPLTRAELDVVRLLAAGRMYKQIAFELDRSPSTVRSHLNHVYKKLGVNDRAQAVLQATRHGWLDEFPPRPKAAAAP